MRSWNDKVVLALGTKGSGVPFLTDSQPANATEKIYASKIYYSSGEDVTGQQVGSHSVD